MSNDTAQKVAAPKDATTKDPNLPFGDTSQTAIYDISAQMVYLPMANGWKRTRASARTWTTCAPCP